MERKDKRMKGLKNKKLEKRNKESFAQIIMVKRIMEGNKYLFFYFFVRTRKKNSLVFSRR